MMFLNVCYVRTKLAMPAQVLYLFVYVDQHLVQLMTISPFHLAEARAFLCWFSLVIPPY